jgi:non-ribosomal peptide synthetase component F
LLFSLHQKLKYCRNPQVPFGLPGEIWVGGTPPTIGYLDLPKESKEKFIVDPFGYPGERVYRTDDMGRWLLNNDIEYIGRYELCLRVEVLCSLLDGRRMDDTVKIRGGFRLSLNGVEQALSREAKEYLKAPLSSAAVLRQSCTLNYL